MFEAWPPSFLYFSAILAMESEGRPLRPSLSKPKNRRISGRMSLRYNADPASACPCACRRPASSAWLSLLPDGEAKRKFILDCTGCHQFDEKIARPGGTPRTEAQWAEAVSRMLGYAGATSFIHAHRRWTGTTPRHHAG